MRVVVILALISASGLLFVLSSCGKNCTLIGCENGVRFRITGRDGGVVNEFDGTASWAGGSAKVECPGTFPSNTVLCREDGFLLQEQPPPAAVQLSIVARSDGGTFDGEVAVPAPTITEPNGEGCGECRLSVTSVQLQ